MNIQLIQIPPLQKFRPTDSFFDHAELREQTVLRGERFCYQVCIRSNIRQSVTVSLESELAPYCKLYLVKNVVMDVPARTEALHGEDYISLEPGLMPDLLLPVGEQNRELFLSDAPTVFWVRADIPQELAAGDYTIRLRLTTADAQSSGGDAESVMQLHVLPAQMPEQQLIYTRWLYIDCIAVQHHVEIFSEQHWQLIDQYIAAAVDVGINMVLVPVHTPPLDVAVGATRPCVQLVDIEKCGENYRFGFERLHRFLAICRKNGVRYYEIAHLFSQWGAKCAANILVTENGKSSYLFGWHTPANDPAYTDFLKQYLTAICGELQKEGISRQTYFHISDEPSLEAIDSYRSAAEIIRPLIGECRTLDALSDYAFYEKGLVECPATSIDHIQVFLDHHVPDQWLYYCCFPESVYANSFLAMPLRRTRMLGFLMYKYSIRGFLHWGFNFYNSILSRYPINPYLTTSADGAFPSGDPFIVYPGQDAALPSMRGETMYAAIQDMDLCLALERRIGRNAVVQMIDEEAGYDIRFDRYPKNDRYLTELHAKMVQRIAQEDAI